MDVSEAKYMEVYGPRRELSIDVSIIQEGHGGPGSHTWDELWWLFCSAERDHFSNFGSGSSNETFLWNYFEMGPLALEEMSFKGFSIFNSGGHFVQRSWMAWAILVEDVPRNNPIKFGWNPPSGYTGDVGWSFFFYFYALAAILCSRADRFEQFWNRTSKGTILSILNEIRLIFMEETSFEAKCGWQTTDTGWSQ